jgi:hypothetical protein
MADRSLRAALLSLRWDGFQSAAEIAASLPRWSLATITDRLRSLAGEGLLWSVLESGARLTPMLTPKLTPRFAQIRTDTADLLITVGPRSLRRSWKPVRRMALLDDAAGSAAPRSSSRAGECEAACWRTSSTPPRGSPAGLAMQAVEMPLCPPPDHSGAAGLMRSSHPPARQGRRRRRPARPGGPHHRDMAQRGEIPGAAKPRGDLDV